MVCHPLFSHQWCNLLTTAPRTRQLVHDNKELFAEKNKLLEAMHENETLIEENKKLVEAALTMDKDNRRLIKDNQNLVDAIEQIQFKQKQKEEATTTVINGSRDVELVASQNLETQDPPAAGAIHGNNPAIDDDRDMKIEALLRDNEQMFQEMKRLQEALRLSQMGGPVDDRDMKIEALLRDNEQMFQETESLKEALRLSQMGHPVPDDGADGPESQLGDLMQVRSCPHLAYCGLASL